MLRKVNRLALILGLLALGALPLAAQTPTPDPASQVVVVGTVDLRQGVIMVNDYIIEPAVDMQVPILYQGDLVVVIGYLQPDGVTIKATSIELFVGSLTPTMTPTPDLSATPTYTPMFTPTVTPTPSFAPISAVCNQPNQPVAQRLADAFHVSYAEIMGWHCRGFGFGEIARAYLLADATGAAPATYFNMRLAGLGWGEIVHQTGVQPSDLAPGQVIRHGNGNGNGHGTAMGMVTDTATVTTISEARRGAVAPRSLFLTRPDTCCKVVASQF